jgi:hypothetical protein
MFLPGLRRRAGGGRLGRDRRGGVEPFEREGPRVRSCARPAPSGCVPTFTTTFASPVPYSDLAARDAHNAPAQRVQQSGYMCRE